MSHTSPSPRAPSVFSIRRRRTTTGSVGDAHPSMFLYEVTNQTNRLTTDLLPTALSICHPIFRSRDFHPDDSLRLPACESAPTGFVRPTQKIQLSNINSPVAARHCPRTVLLIPLFGTLVSIAVIQRCSHEFLCFGYQRSRKLLPTVRRYDIDWTLFFFWLASIWDTTIDFLRPHGRHFWITLCTQPSRAGDRLPV